MTISPAALPYVFHAVGLIACIVVFFIPLLFAAHAVSKPSTRPQTGGRNYVE